MNRKLTGTSVIAVVAILSITLMVGVSETQTTTAEAPKTPNDAYAFAEGVNPKATFQFRETAVAYDFQLFSQINGLFATVNSGTSTRSPTPEFMMQRVVGETPYLHAAVDQTWEYRGRTTGVDYPYRSFDVTVDFVNKDQTLRTFKYKDCTIANYKIVTLEDKEEGYIPGGKTVWALVEQYTFQCSGWQPVSPSYQAIKNNHDRFAPFGG